MFQTKIISVENPACKEHASRWPSCLNAWQRNERRGDRRCLSNVEPDAVQGALRELAHEKEAAGGVRILLDENMPRAEVLAA